MSKYTDNSLHANYPCCFVKLLKFESLPAKLTTDFHTFDIYVINYEKSCAHRKRAVAK